VKWSDAVTPEAQDAGNSPVSAAVLRVARRLACLAGTCTATLGIRVVVVGGVGLMVPKSACDDLHRLMVAAFPIGWTVSRVMAIFLPGFTRFCSSDGPGCSAVASMRSYWTAKEQPGGVKEYFRQF
jgi:hypothetical protein